MRPDGVLLSGPGEAMLSYVQLNSWLHWAGPTPAHCTLTEQWCFTLVITTVATIPLIPAKANRLVPRLAIVCARCCGCPVQGRSGACTVHQCYWITRRPWGVGIELSLALLRAGDPSIDRSSETKAVVTSIFIFNWPTNHSDPALCGMIAGHLPDETLGIKRESRWNHARTGIIKCSPPSLSSSSLHQW